MAGALTVLGTVARGPTDQIHQRFVARVRAAARARQMQLTHVPDHAGVSRSHFWDVLAGKKSPTLGWVAEVAGALHCEPSELICRDAPGALPPRLSRAGRQVPLMSFRAAAAAAGLPRSGEVEPAMWIIAATRRALRPGMFASAVSGRAMEPLIRDGAICLFRLLEGRDPDGKVVVVQLRGLRDPETGGRYLVRRFRVASRRGERVQRLHLEPSNRTFRTMVLEKDPMSHAAPIAEFLEVMVPSPG